MHDLKYINGQKTWTSILCKKNTNVEYHMKTCSTSSAIREKQIKTIIRCYFAATKLGEVKKPDNSEFWQWFGSTGGSDTLLVEGKLVQRLQKTIWHYFIQLKILYASTLRYLSSSLAHVHQYAYKWLLIHTHRHICINV